MFFKNIFEHIKAKIFKSIPGPNIFLQTYRKLDQDSFKILDPDEIYPQNCLEIQNTAMQVRGAGYGGWKYDDPHHRRPGEGGHQGLPQVPPLTQPRGLHQRQRRYNGTYIYE